MKNQYFGDRNDYFKFDLCIFLVENLPKIEKFTFIPMLTADDGGRDGLKVSYPMGVGRESIYKFLQKCLVENRRGVTQLRSSFENQKLSFEYCPYGDSRDLEFTHSNQDQYFEEIPDSTLQSAVILVDPDNGLEVKSSRPGDFHKFIKYSEMKQLYQRMDSDSVLVLYQHFRHSDHKTFIYHLHFRLQEELGCPLPVTVADSQIALILVCKSETAAGKSKEGVVGISPARSSDL